MPARREVQTFENAHGQTVAMDDHGSWRVYNLNTKAFGAFAKGPVLQVAEPTPPGVEPAEPAAATPVPPAPPNHEEEIERLSNDLARVKELLQRADAALHDAHAKLQEDTTEIAQLRSEVAELETKLAEAVKAKSEQSRRFETLRDECTKFQRAAEESAAKEKEANGKLPDKDKRIAELEKERDDALTRSAAAAVKTSKVAEFRSFTAQHPYMGLGGLAASVLVLLLLLGFTWYGFQQFWFPREVAKEVVKPPADYEAIKSELAILKSGSKETASPEIPCPSGWNRVKVPGKCSLE